MLSTITTWFINPSSALSCPLNRMTHCVQISGGVETVTAFKETVLGKSEAAVLVVAVVLLLFAQWKVKWHNNSVNNEKIRKTKQTEFIW